MDAKRQKKFRLFLFSKRSHAGKGIAGESSQLRPPPPLTTFITNPEKTNKSEANPSTPYFSTPYIFGATCGSQEAKPRNFMEHLRNSTQFLCFAISYNPLRRLAQGAPRTFLPATSRKSMTHKEHAYSNNKKGARTSIKIPRHIPIIFLPPRNNSKACVTYNPFKQGANLSHQKAKPRYWMDKIQNESQTRALRVL